MLARRDSKNVDGKRPLSATGAVGDKLKTEPVEQVLDPGSKSLAEVLEIVASRKVVPAMSWQNYQASHSQSQTISPALNPKALIPSLRSAQTAIYV
ncbi:uncharacterized protein LOC142349464 isoform X3 [Convolutriloba macropyga]|uniref:uncharacterized protein LOC142349464 isoform X3 n=1 Tax=Convolutriloba macropyga TaxID=536237 RepID=UPI003F527A66